MPFSIVVVGWGITRLAQTGHHVQIVERRDSSRPVDNGSSGILLGPNAMRILAELGLQEDIERMATESRQTSLRRYDTGEVLRILHMPANGNP